MFSSLKFTIFVYTLIIYSFMNYLSVYHYLSAYYNWYFDETKNNTNYDYIVVGAGSAGSIIASRLSKSGENVLLLEAGGMPPLMADIPSMAPILQKSKYDWQYVTVPQKHACKGLINQRSIWPMGKILGGSSRLNYMIYVNGHPHDYNSWFPDYEEPIVEKNGPLHIQPVQWSSKMSGALLEGVREMSHSVHDINKNSQPGFMKVHLTMKDGTRWSTDKLLSDVKNLSIMTDSYVQKILFEGKVAKGVEFERLGTKYVMFAKKAVIMSAGAIGSPKILMLSGIGPKDHLTKHKIPIIADLPVGKNLVDHIVTGFDLITLNISQPISLFDVLNPKSIFEYLFEGKGPWTFAGIEVTGTFYKSKTPNKSHPPDLQILALPGGISQDVGVIIRETFGISDKVYENYFAPLENKVAVTISPVLLHPKSSGYIQLQSTNPQDPPLINPRYLSEKEDVDTMIAGLQFVKKLIKTNSMQSIGATLYEKSLPGCENFVFDSYDYWECYIRHLTLTCYHPAGTCKMGEVVDNKFKVYGVKNLYVVDASVFPVLPSGNTNAGVAMLAEKFADLITDTNRKTCSTKCYVEDIFVR